MHASRLWMALPLVLGLAAPARADEHALGFAVGATTGAGFSYRYLSDLGLGLQCSGLAAKFGSSSWVTAAGAQAIVTLLDGRWGRLYAVGGGSRYGDTLYFGAGPGIELGRGTGVSLALDVPISYSRYTGILPIPNLSVLYTF